MNETTEPTEQPDPVEQLTGVPESEQTPGMKEISGKKQAAAVSKATKEGNGSGLTIQDTARLHEKAVQAVARGEVPQAVRKARKKAEKKQPPVHTHIQAPDFLWEAAQAMVKDPKNSYTRAKVVPNPEAIGGVEVIVR